MSEPEEKVLTCAAGVDAPYLALVFWLLGEALEDAFCHGRPADIAQANE
jgi:hypothetical protein